MAAHVPLAAASPSLEDVVERLDRYLAAYEPRLSAVVADEEYEQWLSGFVLSGPRPMRILQSEFLFTRLPNGAPWTGFRDTVTVDGHPVRDRDAGLQQLVADGSDGALEQAARIVAENARYNLGDGFAFRTINTPTLTLDFFHPTHRSQVSFRKRGEETIDGTRVWKIDFVERPPSMIRTPAGREQKTRGSVWVNPLSGAIARTLLNVVISPTSEAKITVEYRDQAALGFAAPYEMRESYRPGVEGRARYAHFRKFETSVRILEK